MNTQHYDVIIVGAGLSGIGAAHYLQERCPTKSFAILEMRASMGGTWDLFKYPGIRSDSDMHTLGYAFRPWKASKAIADGPAILQYIKDTAADEGIDKKIQYGKKVVGADWSSDDNRWTISVEDIANDSIQKFSCNFLYMCSGYYSYESGYTPTFKGSEDFKGRIVHPQKWTEDIDYTNKKVVVIGSGATAVTLVPELAKEATKVTMLQRSPTYIVSQPAKDKFANFMRKILPSKLAYSLTRWKNVSLGIFFYGLTRRFPKFMKGLFIKGVHKELKGSGLSKEEINKHFTPSYNPWDQRLCLVPDSDLFRVIKKRKAAVVTDHIDRFTENGILLQSGEELSADLIVTATGLNMQLVGNMTMTVDDKVIKPNEHYVFRGTMFSDIPNFALAAGYTNASWTLKTDLSCEYICRLINHMDKTGTKKCTPRVKDKSMNDEPLIDFSSGYVQRSVHELPKQGSKAPWKLHQNYALDVINFRYSSLKEDTLEFV